MALHAIFLSALAPLSPLSPVALPQASFFTVEGSDTARELGRAVGRAGDVDGDGIVDVIIGVPKDSSLILRGGSARVHSGASGAELYRFDGTGFSDFGESVCGIGDVDGDGFDDLAVGSSKDSTFGFWRGTVTIYSGQDGSVIRVLQGPRINGLFGGDMANVGDIDGDGVSDLIVGARTGALGPVRGKGSIGLFSGATGTRLLVIEGTADDAQFGVTIAPIGDLDGDGKPDILVGAPLENSLDGALRVFSSVTGNLLFEVIGTSSNGLFSSGASALPDIDGDGLPDIVASTPTYGRLSAYSGSSSAGTATLLWEVSSSIDEGHALELIDDRDGDGLRDFLSCTLNQLFVRSSATGAIILEFPTRLDFIANPRNELAFLGDVNGDGSEDLVVGSSRAYDFAQTGIAPIGRAYVFSGASPVSQVVCSASASSPEIFALAGYGSTSAQDNELTLSVTGAGSGRFGYFVTSLGNDVVVNPGGSVGTLCISDPLAGIGRHLDSLDQTVSDGVLQYKVDLGNIPGPNGALTVLSGETRYWQAWLRGTDPAGNSISTFSSAASVTFQ